MFEDEGRFGRISSPRRCWSPKGTRAIVGKQIVREYTYAYAAIDPQNGDLDSLILPNMYATTMAVFLEELSKRYPQYYILLVMDGAPCHRSGDLKVPANIQIQEQPPYSPELNPVEHLWDEMREKWFHNETFDFMEKVEERMVMSLTVLENDQRRMQSLAGFPWITQSLVPS
jgi:transposase-like protein